MMKMNGGLNMRENVRERIVEKVSQKVISFGDPMEILGGKCFLSLLYEPEMPQALLSLLNEE